MWGGGAIFGQIWRKAGGGRQEIDRRIRRAGVIQGIERRVSRADERQGIDRRVSRAD